MVCTYQTTVGKEIKGHCALRPKEVAVAVTGFEPLSYEALQCLIDEVSRELRLSGFGRDARIAIALPNGPHAALAIVAVTCYAVAVPLDLRHTRNEIEMCLDVLRPDAIILLRGNASAARHAAEQRGIAIVESVVPSEGAIGFKIVASRGGQLAPVVEPDPDAPAFILQTSGTTSEPKLIPFSHRNLLAAAARIQAWFKLTPQDRCLSLTPVFYSHGLKVTVFAPLLSGGTVAFPTDASKFDFSEWFSALRPTWYSAGPTLHRLILDQTQGKPGAKTGHQLRFITGGGAPLTRDVLEGLQHTLGVPVLEHYGTSEAALIASNEVPPGRSKKGTCGVPWPDSLMIVDENGHRRPPAEQGEILVHGPTVMAGYLDAPELNRASFVDGWLKTGDIGSLDEDGFLTLRGRQKDIINRGGEKIWPIEIDDSLTRHSAVAEAAAFSVPHPRLGEDVVAAVVLRPGMRASPIELRAFLSERLAPFKVPRRVYILDQLPKVMTGKISRRQLRESLGAAKALPAAAPDTSPDSDLSFQLKFIWERLLNAAPVSVDDDFFEKGGDSLLAVELLSEIEWLTGRTVSNSLLFEATTIRQIAQRLSEGYVRSPRSLAKLSPSGDQTPLFLFHGDPGGGYYAIQLARLLGSDQPLFAIAPHGIHNESVPRSLEEMAAECLPSIIQAHPQGPYRLCGYCIGGLIAFEVARILVLAGKRVEIVFMIDSPTANARRSFQGLFSILNYIRSFGAPVHELVLARTWHFIHNYKSTTRQWCAKAVAKARNLTVIGKNLSYRVPQAAGRNISDKPNDPSSIPTPFCHMPFAHYFWRHAIAMSNYIPKPLAVRVVHFSARYAGKSWRRISPDLEVIILNSGHHGIKMNLNEVADHLRARLGKNGIGTQ